MEQTPRQLLCTAMVHAMARAYFVQAYNLAGNFSHPYVVVWTRGQKQVMVAEYMPWHQTPRLHLEELDEKDTAMFQREWSHVVDHLALLVHDPSIETPHDVDEPEMNYE
jgi:hypothetical protein